MPELVLKVKTRELAGNKTDKIRAEGKIPAVLYGRGIDNQNLEIDYKEFINVFKEAGESTLVDLVIDDKEPVKVLIHNYQKDPVKDNFIHIDFYQVRMDEEITADVELVFVGESQAVKALGGIMVKNLNKLEIKCLPADLIGKIEVDISALNTFEDSVCVADLPVSENVKVIDNPDEIVVNVSAPRTQEELEELDKEFEEKFEDVEKAGEEGEAKEGEEGKDEEKEAGSPEEKGSPEKDGKTEARKDGSPEKK